MSNNKNEKIKDAFVKNMKKHKGNKRAQLATVIIFGTIALCTVIFEKD